MGYLGLARLRDSYMNALLYAIYHIVSTVPPRMYGMINSMLSES